MHLLAHGPRSKTALYTELKISPVVFLKSVLPPLLENNLVEQKEERRGLRKTETHIVGLTPWGKKVALSLVEVDGTIREARMHTEAV